MQSRALREGTLGLVILGGVACFAGLFVWIYNLQFGERGYSFSVRFSDAGGLIDGGVVRLRGIQVGKIARIVPEPNAVRADVIVSHHSTAIPLKSQFLSNQTGLIGQTTLDIVPQQEIQGDTFDPLAEDCETVGTIVCEGSEVNGDIGVNYGELLAQMDSLLSYLNEDDLLNNVSTLTASITDVSQSVARISKEIERDVDFKSLTAAAQSIQSASAQLDAAIATNQPALEGTLGNLAALSQDMREISTSLKPLLTDKEFAANLGTIASNTAVVSANTAEASKSLKAIASGLSDPNTLASLRSTLDSARVTFDNAEKITTDLDDLVGDPQFRQSLRDLVLGLDNLVSYDGSAVGGTRPAGAMQLPLRYSFTPIESITPSGSIGEIERRPL